MEEIGVDTVRIFGKPYNKQNLTDLELKKIITGLTNRLGNDEQQLRKFAPIFSWLADVSCIKTCGLLTHGLILRQPDNTIHYYPFIVFMISNIFKSIEYLNNPELAHKYKSNFINILAHFDSDAINNLRDRNLNPNCIGALIGELYEREQCENWININVTNQLYGPIIRTCKAHRIFRFPNA